MSFSLLLSLAGGTWAESNKRAADASKPTDNREADASKQVNKRAADTPKLGDQKKGGAPKQDNKKEAGPPKPVTITANRMEANRKLHIVIYIDDVIVKKEDLTIYAQKVEFLFDEKMEKIQQMMAEGGVRIVDLDKTETAEKAVYLNDQDILVLTGNPKVWQGENVITGSKMTLLRKEDRSIVEGNGKERITSVFYPSKEGGGPKVGAGTLQRGKTDEEKSPKSKE